MYERCLLHIYIYIYINIINYIYTALQKFGNALEKWGFGQYWHESFLICDNFALIRDNTNYENIFYYINSLYIENLNFGFIKISTISSYYSSA